MPYRFNPIAPNSSFPDALPVINGNFAQLDGEAVTKAFNQANGQLGEVIGKLPGDTGYGITLYDSDGNTSIYIAMTDNGPVAKIAKKGKDATTALAADLTFDGTKSFIVVATGTVTFPDQSVGSGLTATATSVVIPHGASFKPAVACYAPLQLTGSSLPVFPPDFPTNLSTFMLNGSLIYQTNLIQGQVYYGVDDTNIYIGYGYINDSGSTATVKGAPITYYAYSSSASA